MEEDFIANPWKSDILHTPASPPEKSLPDAKELMEKMLGGGDQDQIHRRKKQLHAELCNIVSSPNTARIQEILKLFEDECLPSHLSSGDKELAWKEFLDRKDIQGSSPLHYAACFGNKEACYLLLSRGASVNVQDKHGWTPLVWATNNGHDVLSNLLMERGASPDTMIPESKMTVGDFLSHSAPKPVASDAAFYRAAAYDYHGAVEEELNSHLYPYQSFGNETDRYQVDENSLDDSDELTDVLSDRDEVSGVFKWDQCLPDQMFVFDHRQIEPMLDILVSKLKMPHITRSNLSTKLATANSVFLASRYAHYYGGGDLLESLLEQFCQRIKSLLGEKKRDMCLLSYWLANLSQLLYYLKRDPELLESTAAFQVRLLEAINDIYTWLIEDGEQRLGPLVIKGICDYESIPGGDKIEFDSSRRRRSRDEDKTFFGTVFSRFKKSPSRTTSSEDIKMVASETKDSASSLSQHFSIFSPFQASTKPKPPPDTASPRSITTALASSLFVLQEYQVHPSLQAQYVRQMFYFIGSSVLNAFLNHDEYCNRWKAMQIRINLSTLEDWLRLYSHVGTSNQLLKRTRRRSVESTGKGKSMLEDLLYQIPVRSMDFYFKWFHSAVAACQLMQIATTAFAEGKGETIVQDFKDTVASFAQQNDSSSPVETHKRTASVHEWNTFNTSLSYAQMHRLLVKNYKYEKDEPRISSKVLDYLEDNRLRKLGPGEKTPSITPSQSSSDLNTVQEKKKSPPLAHVTLYKDASFQLPFRLSFVPVDQMSSTDALKPGEWHDPTDAIERQRRQRKREQEREGEERWWETRIKIDVPDWLVKAIE